MLQTEFVRSLHSNYERILLEEKPEEKRYQYCILSRGGIKGLLSCSLRYINGEAYLYYDISSMQSMAQIYGNRPISREWLKNFMWSLHQIRRELGRFLLDDSNILLYPEQIFQDLESRKISFLYIPYYEGENGFLKLVEFWVEHIDYDDEILVECVYQMYEQFEKYGDVYLQAQIFEDAKLLDKKKESLIKESAEIWTEAVQQISSADRLQKEGELEMAGTLSMTEGREARKGLFRLLENRKRKAKEERGSYREKMQQETDGYAVAEEAGYEEEYGKTIYVEEIKEEEVIHRLFTEDGRVLARLDKSIFTIGKKKGESDLILEDASVSRLHARIIQEKDAVYLEDMNSTNGTFKNGLRMQPYEKRELDREDEIKIGKTVIIYR